MVSAVYPVAEGPRHDIRSLRKRHSMEDTAHNMLLIVTLILLIATQVLAQVSKLHVIITVCQSL